MIQMVIILTPENTTILKIWNQEEKICEYTGLVFDFYISTVTNLWKFVIK